MEMYNEIHTGFMPAHTTSTLQLMDQVVILTFKSYSLRNTFHKTIAATDGDSSAGSGKSQLKIFWKGFAILDAIKDLCDSWEEVKISTLTGFWNTLIPTLMDNFEGFKTSAEEVTANVVEKNMRIRIKCGG